MPHVDPITFENTSCSCGLSLLPRAATYSCNRECILSEFAEALSAASG